jgi:hypothetical protein
MTPDAESNGPRVAFIFGAGLSAPYGFPVGDTYRRMLLKMADWEKGEPLHLFDPNQEVDAIVRNEAAVSLLTRLLGDKTETHRRRIIGRAFRASGAVSIDRFVSGAVKDGREPVREIARKLVVLLLSCCEPNRTMDSGAYRMLLDLWGLDELERARLNPACFISFNYDRCFERAIFERTGRASWLGAAHIYGQLGRWFDPTDNSDARVDKLDWCSWRDPSMHHARLDACASIIDFMNTPSQFKYTSPNFAPDAARSYLASASTIVFLGFGFDPNNCRLIGLPQHDAERGWPIFSEDVERNRPGPVSLEGKTLLATTYGMDDAEVNLIVDALLGPTRDERWEEQRARFEDMACEPFLERHRETLERALG